MKKITLSIIRFYQIFISRGILHNLFGNSCRFAPPCSDYTYQAVKRYGTIKGSFLGIKRILHCQPFSKHV